MLCWIVFVLRFIEQLHAVRSRQVLYDIRGNVGLNMLQLPCLCKLAVRQRLGGRLHVQRRLVGPQRRHVRAVRGGKVHESNRLCRVYRLARGHVLYHLGCIVFIHLRVVLGVIWQILPVCLNLSHRVRGSCGLRLSRWNQ